MARTAPRGRAEQEARLTRWRGARANVGRERSDTAIPHFSLRILSLLRLLEQVFRVLEQVGHCGSLIRNRLLGRIEELAKIGPLLV